MKRFTYEPDENGYVVLCNGIGIAWFATDIDAGVYVDYLEKEKIVNSAAEFVPTT